MAETFRQRGNRRVTTKQFGDWSYALFPARRCGAFAPQSGAPRRRWAARWETRLGGGLQIQVCLSSGKSPLLQVDGLIMPRLVELCAPHLVHALVVGAAEGHGRAKPNVEIVQIFQGSH